MKKIGTYELGFRQIHLYVDQKSTSGSVGLRSCKMVIGTEDTDWWRVVALLLHEAIEAAAIDLHCRFNDTSDGYSSDDSVVFHMTHPQYSQVIAQAAEFLTSALPDLAREYNAAQRSNRKTTARKKRKR